MKTKEEILKDNYIIHSNGRDIVFNNKTPKRTAEKLIGILNSGIRVVFDFGNIEMMESWNEIYGTTGYIGLSKGFYNLYWPLLVHNKRSIGGSLLLTHCILTIKRSKGKELLFTHKPQQHEINQKN